MLEVNYLYNEDCSLTEVSFEGLTGAEDVSSVKEALNVMAVVNPAVRFLEHVKVGAYNEMTDEEYQAALENMKCISNLWHFEDAPWDDQNGEYRMNPLTLLANALELITAQNTRLRMYRQEEDLDEELMKAVLTGQSDMMAEELRRDVLETALRYTEYRFRWELYSREEKTEKDGARRVAHDAFTDRVNIYIRYLNGYHNAKLTELGDDRKKNGDLACRIVSRVGISNR